MLPARFSVGIQGCCIGFAVSILLLFHQNEF